MSDQTARAAELRANLEAVRGRIAAACDAAGRPVSEVELIAVTKYFPFSDALLLAELGVRDFGENRDQEAAQKVADFTAARSAAGEPGGESGPAGGAAAPRWHFVGRLQTNKAKSVARYADMVHSVDRTELVRALDRGVERAGRPPLAVLLQVSLDGDTARGGAVAQQLPELAELVSGCQSLRLAGLMAVAPLGADPDSAFGQLAELSAGIRERHPAARTLSAGMSSDLEAAVRHGATHLRIGTALLGRRADTFG
jgi:hypothetical protein